MTQLLKPLKVPKMLSLFNPGIWLAVLLACLGSFWYGHHVAYVEQAAEIARLNQKAVELKDKADENLNKEKRNAQAKINSLQSAIASGDQRLFINVKTPICDSSATAGDGQTGAELDRETAKNLVSITADGDQAIIDLNSCIDRYNSLRSLK